MATIKNIFSKRAAQMAIICATVVFAIAYSPASNAQIIIGPTVSLASLTNVGGDVLVGDKDFSNFSISGSFSAGQINVTSITENGNFGIRFSGSIISGANPMDLILGYKVAVTNSANLISQANLLFNGSVTGTGLASVVEQVFTNNNDFAGQMNVFVSATTNQFSDSLAITPPQPFLT